MKIILYVTACLFMTGPWFSQVMVSASGQDVNQSEIEDSQVAISASDESPAISIEAVTSLKQQLSSLENLSPENKAEAESFFDQAMEQLRRGDEQAAATAKWEGLRADAPALLQDLNDKLETPVEPFELSVQPDATLVSLEQRLANVRQQLDEAEKELVSRKNESIRRADRRAEINERVPDLTEKIAEIDESLSGLSTPGASVEVIQAQKAFRLATRLASERELNALAAELRAYDATVSLVELEPQIAQRKLTRLQAEFESLVEYISKQRLLEATQREREAKSTVSKVYPVLQPIAEENVRLTQLRTGPDGLTSKIKETADELIKTKAAVAQVREMETEIVEKLRLPGMKAIAGPMLYQMLSDLPRISDLQRSIYLRNRLMSGVRFKMADVRTQKSRLDDRTDEVAATLQNVSQQTDASQRESLTSSAEQLFTQRRQLLHDLEVDYTTYFNELNELNAAQQQLLTLSLDVNESADTNLMWIRANDTYTWSDFTECGAVLRWVCLPENWRQVGNDAWAAINASPVLCIASVVLFIALAIGRKTFKAALGELGVEAAKSYLVPFSTTVKALAYTILLTLLWPSLIFSLGFCLYQYMGAAEFSRAVGRGLIASAEVCLLLELTRRLLGKDGLAESHFKWSNRRILSLRRNLLWLMLISLPLVFLSTHIQWEGVSERKESLGRLLSIAALIVVAVFMHLVLRTRSNSGQEHRSRNPTSAGRVIYWISVLLPLFVASLSFFGFHFTARQLSLRIFYTACLALGMLIIQGLAVRWLRLVRGNFALHQAELRREAKRQAVESETKSIDEAEVDTEPEIDLQKINVQTRKLLQVFVAVTVAVGLWFIWLDVLPGSSWFEIPIWSTAREVSRIVEGPDGKGIPKIVNEFQIVTPGLVLLAVMVAFIAFLASRNVPGLVEVGLPQSAPLDAGARYALSTILRYALIAIGIIAASSILGISWSKVQWLVAALSVGVGFGLQELVANFVSGLILLFERPVRVGDIVTVDGVTGVVTRMQIRATTVRNWDRQDYLVPNKDLITGRVLNWTLSSKVNRVVINVGVAYGSDARHVRQLLQQILREHDNIMYDPTPMVTFEQFGDSTLDFVVRAYLANHDSRLETINDLHTIIHERFAEDGIEIAFPQRDINIRTLPESGETGLSSLDGANAPETDADLWGRQSRD